MWIVPWDSFLIKKLLKSEICGSVNNVRYALIDWKLPDKSNFAAIVHALVITVKFDWKLPDKSNFAAIVHALVITVKFVPKRVKKKKRKKKEKRKTQTQTQTQMPNPNVA